MRHFFIRVLDLLIGVVVVIGILGVLISSAAMITVGVPGPDGTTISGVGPGIAVLVAGLLYMIFLGGFMYLGVGIYHNTRRTAEAVEQLAGK